MGKKKVTAGEVLEVLQNNETIKVKELSVHLKCGKGTIGNRVKDLRNEGKAILPTPDGLMLIDVVDENNKESVQHAGQWIIGEIVGISRIGDVAKKPLIQVRKILSLTEDERKELKKTLLYITRLVDNVNVDLMLE